FVLLTFDDAVTKAIYDEYYEKLLLDRRNPDNRTIGATFYVPHEYTDYTCVNKLYNAGFEIASHSISKNISIYWKTASKEQLVDEFKGQREIISTNANIPLESIRGVRTPHLQLAGNRSFEAYDESGYLYDSSWPTLSIDKLYPYNLKYLSTQQCVIGECPTNSLPNFWVIPINNLVGNQGIDCNSLYACNVEGNSTVVLDWLQSEFQKNFGSSRAPLKLLINSVWMSQQENFEALQMFLDFLQEQQDVFLVNENDLVEWMKDPVEVQDYVRLSENEERECVEKICVLKHGIEDRYMGSCVTCPSVYPWLQNPMGKVY
ncbi:PREDICTED: uncharacterized protein LOC108557619, partial [Nicrophorus vespilloides]|uniref:Uncharacterized protein LOC108557619 n=1 Tax=Nicrophorus vespilloides TaxID=110193 RepID=A0ABM1M554_NICVS